MMKWIWLLLLMAMPLQTLAQDGAATTSPAGLSMLVLFMGAAAIIAVLVTRWSQSAADDED